MTNMDIVACLDKGFVMPTGVMMYSACANNQDTEITFHLVVDESVTDADRNDLKKTVESFHKKKVTFYSYSRNFQEMPALANCFRLTQSAYYRLFLTEILPVNLDKVLYLDGDIIVRHSLLPLWNTSLADFALAAVTDYDENDMNKYERLKYPRSYSYFNSGVLLINLKYWRSNNVVKVFNSYIEEHRSDIIHHDQDVLNAVFYDKKVNLPLTFNLSLGFYKKNTNYDYQKYKDEVLEARKDPVIIHYTISKPWHYCRYTHPLNSSFFKYQSQTRWKDWPITDQRPLLLRLRHAVADTMRKLNLWPKLPQLFDDMPPVD